MRIAPCIVLAVGLVTCSETVQLKDRARQVEFLTHEYTGQHGYQCEEVGTLSVSAIPAENSGESKLSVLEVKLKNEAEKLGATHVLKWPSREWPCNKDGTENPESERQCSKMEGTAYTCVVGRGT